MPTDRVLSYADAIHEAMELSMERDPNVYLIGEGVPDPKAVFGTTRGLQERFGRSRVMDMPVSENALTGVTIGTALRGFRPILIHLRIDFALLSMDQIINGAAKWHFMFNGKLNVPLVIRMIVGRGWGQGAQHSQNLEALFSHIPGLKVIVPASPHDVKGLLISAVEDNNPVISIEHRWLYYLKGHVPPGYYRVPLGEPQVVREGTDVTVVASSYMTALALKAAEFLTGQKIRAEVIDLRTLNPFHEEVILKSVRKTGRLLVADSGWMSCGFAAEVMARVSEKAFSELQAPPRRVTLPDIPTPTAPSLLEDFYPDQTHLVCAIHELVTGRGLSTSTVRALRASEPHAKDVPNRSFTGPF